MDHKCTGAECPCVEAEAQRVPQKASEQSVHMVDNVPVTCIGEDCPLCLYRDFSKRSIFEASAPSWEWYARFLLQYSVREARACRQKLLEYGFDMQDIFAPIERVTSYDRESGWWRTWLEHGYGRHGEAVKRLLTGFFWIQIHQPLRKRIGDLFGYSALGLARIAYEQQKKGEMH